MQSSLLFLYFQGGIFWILMMDRYLDRFLFVFLVIAGATYLICYGMHSSTTAYILHTVLVFVLHIAYHILVFVGYV